MEKEQSKDKGLPGHSYTNRQLFWIAAAQVGLTKKFAIDSEFSGKFYILKCFLILELLW